MQMKRILGILLALCFLMSVTAAAVSAAPDKVDLNKKDDQKGDFNKKNDDKKGDFNKKNDDKFKPKGHWEIKKVKHVAWKHGHKVVWFTFVKVFVPNHFPVFHR
jgi:hypothetical protein